MELIRVVVAEDHTIVRRGLDSILEKQPGIKVIAEAGDGREAVSAAETYKPDVILMDFSMPGLNGLEATRQIKKRVPDTKILILTRHANLEYIKSLFNVGATGYLLKKSAVDELVLAIESVYRGDIYLDPLISKQVTVNDLQLSKMEPWQEKLTSRQSEVLQLIAEGLPNRKIASILNISVKTVENHRTNLMQILGLQSTAELIQFAIRKGIISLDD